VGRNQKEIVGIKIKVALGEFDDIFDEKKCYHPERHAKPIKNMESVEILLLPILSSDKFGKEREDQSNSRE